MEIKDYYKVLNVPESATLDEIKRSFRELAKKYHPDINKAPDAEAKFKEVNEAYQILSDPDKKIKYDEYKKYGGNPFAGGGGGGGSAQDIFADLFGGGFRSGGVEDISDLFSGFFGGGERRNSYEDLAIHIQITLTFEESYSGTEKYISFNRASPCAFCGGSGATEKTACPHCKGRGSIASNSGFFSMQRTCPYCKGTGSIAKTKCNVCQGTGKKHITEKKAVKIPSGARTGDKLTIKGLGNSENGMAGPLVIHIAVMSSPVYSREGNNLVLNLKIDLKQALAGDKVKIRHFGKELTVTIPPGTNNGDVLSLRGMGMKRGRDAGNLHLKISLTLPKKLTKKQKDKLDEFLKTL